jgi:hypothetical protein
MLRPKVLEDFADEIIELRHSLGEEINSFSYMGINFEE